jgi:pullulanase
MTSADAIRRDLNFCAEYKIGVVSYCLDGKAAGDNWSKIFLIFNGNEEPVEFPLPEGRYKVVADANSINEEGIKVVEDTVVVEPVSLKILVHAENG